MTGTIEDTETIHSLARTVELLVLEGVSNKADLEMISDLQRRNEELRQDLSEARDDAFDRISDLCDDVDNLQLRIRELQRALDDRDRVIGEQAAELEDQAALLLQAGGEILDLKATIETLRDEIFEREESEQQGLKAISTIDDHLGIRGYKVVWPPAQTALDVAAAGEPVIVYFED